MRVAVDGRHLRAGAARGVGRYSRLLLGELARQFPGDEWVVVAADSPQPPLAGVELRRPRLARRLTYGAAAIAGRPRLDRIAGGCDVAFLPAPAPAAVSDGIPVVMTVHDLSFEHRASDFSAYERLWHRLAAPRSLARRADRVIAVSDVVAGEVRDEWGVPADRVVTVRSGPGRPPGAAGGLPPGLPDSFFLAVGAIEPRKRPELLVEAHALARAGGLRAGLVFAGTGSLRGPPGGDAHMLGFVDDATLEALYSHALALVCVSREEGFGFTPLEAAARGCPAVVAELAVFGETLGDGALRVPGDDAEALARALVRMESDPALRRSLAESAARAAAGLSWSEAARATRAALAEAAA